MKIALLFPPGWSLMTGSPHLGLPTLAGGLKDHEIIARDLNWDVVNSFYSIKMIGLDKLVFAEKSPAEQMKILNKPYYQAEDKLQKIAEKYDGNWNLQLGLNFQEYSYRSSAQILRAMKKDSPFTEYYKTNIIPWLVYENPGIIALSIAAPAQLIPAFELCWRIKRAGLKGKIVMGGNIISRIWRNIEASAFDVVDCFGIYQGDYTLKELATSMDVRVEKVTEVRNLMYGPYPFEHVNILEKIDPDKIPTPSFAGFPIGRYWGENYLPLNSARGCYHRKCKFCAIPLGWNQRGFSGMRSPQLVIKDIINLYRKHDIWDFKFVDESMSLSTMYAIAKFFGNARGKSWRKWPISWEAYAIMEKKFLDHSFTEKLSEGGCRKLYFGLETISHAGRKAMNKKGLVDPLELLQSCHRAGIKVHFFTMIGFPGTNRKDAKETTDFILEHQDMIDTVDVFPFKFQKDTEVPGIKPIIKKRDDWALDYRYKSLDSDVLSEEEVMEIWKEMEDRVWEAKPTLRHPIYRLLSPWR
jgi:hypothetical protein